MFSDDADDFDALAAAILPPPKPLKIVSGTLDMLLLKLLTLEPMHGYGLSARLAELSGGTFRLGAGSFVAAIRRLEMYGYIRTKWRRTDRNHRARWFEISHVGRMRLRNDTQDWERQTRAIANVLAAEPTGGIRRTGS